LLGLPALAQEGWWMKEPIRWLQTNLRETDSNVNPKELVARLADFRANVLLLNMGGIVAQYPTRIEFHYPSPYLPPGGDLFGAVLEEAHRRGIRVVGRFDFSKTQKAVFDAHPEWFFKKADGQPVVYNDLYSTCINGGYYRSQAMKILEEALERYPVDGLFFNMFGNQSSDYSGRFVGHCHCDACRRKYRELYGAELPAEPDDRYREFMFRSSREVASDIRKLMKSKRPEAGFFNYIQQYTDGIMSESNTAVGRPLPLWPYTSSDNVNRARNSEPGKMSVNLCMQFVDFPWRFATVPAHEITLRLWQNVAHGGALAFAINGIFDQQDRQGLLAARPVFHWLADNEPYYVKQESAAEVILLGAPQSLGRRPSQASYRGLFRFLTEEHIPFAVADNLDWLERRKPALVITGGWAPRELRPYLERGGKALVVTPETPEFYDGEVVKRWSAVQGYMRIRDHSRLPSLKNTNLLMLNGDYTETAGVGSMPLLTLVPPSMFGPPEKIHLDQVDTTKPGVVFGKVGRGQYVWIPWDVGALYYFHSLPAHAGLLRDLTDHLLGGQRQIRTNAHPLVEIALMKQGGRHILHLVNVSGHADTAYHEPVPMRDIRLEVAVPARGARALRSAKTLSPQRVDRFVVFTLPELRDYEAIILE
jgi:hypothetical protein